MGATQVWAITRKGLSGERCGGRIRVPTRSPLADLHRCSDRGTGEFLSSWRRGPPGRRAGRAAIGVPLRRRQLDDVRRASATTYREEAPPAAPHRRQLVAVHPRPTRPRDPYPRHVGQRHRPHRPAGCRRRPCPGRPVRTRVGHDLGALRKRAAPAARLARVAGRSRALEPKRVTRRVRLRQDSRHQGLRRGAAFAWLDHHVPGPTPRDSSSSTTA